MVCVCLCTRARVHAHACTHIGHCQKKERRLSSPRYCPHSPAGEKSATSSSGCSVSLGVVLLLLLSPLVMFNSLVFVFTACVDSVVPSFLPHPPSRHARECISREDPCEAGRALRPNHHFTLRLQPLHSEAAGVHLLHVTQLRRGFLIIFM